MEDQALLLLKRAFLTDWLETGAHPHQEQVHAELVFIEGCVQGNTTETAEDVRALRAELANALTPETFPLVQRYLMGEQSSTTDYHLERSKRMISWLEQGNAR